MKISKRSRYALRLCLDLAVNQKDGCVSLSEISQRQGVSKKFLEHVVQDLNKEGILQTYRGFTGGYRLARDVQDISLADILRATETTSCLVSCMNQGEYCAMYDVCVSRSVWGGLMQVVDEYCKKMTLDVILKQTPNGNGLLEEKPVFGLIDGCSKDND